MAFNSRLSRSMPLLWPPPTTTPFFLSPRAVSPPPWFCRRPVSLPRRRRHYVGGVPTTLIGADSYPNRGRTLRRLIMVGGDGRCYGKLTRSSSSAQLSSTTVFCSMDDLRDTARKKRATSCEDVYRDVQTAVWDSPGLSESGVSLNDSRCTDLGSCAGLEDGDGVSQCSFGSSSAFHETTCDSELDRPDSDCLSMPGSLYGHTRGEVVSQHGDSFSSRHGESSRGRARKKSRHDSGGRDKFMSELTTSSGRSSPGEFRKEFYHSTPTKRGSPVLSIFPGDEEDLHFPSTVPPDSLVDSSKDPLLFSPIGNSVSKDSQSEVLSDSLPDPSRAFRAIDSQDAAQTHHAVSGLPEAFGNIVTQDTVQTDKDHASGASQAAEKSGRDLFSSQLERERSSGETVQSWLTTGHPQHREVVTDPHSVTARQNSEQQRPGTDHNRRSWSSGSVRDRVKAIEQQGSEQQTTPAGGRGRTTSASSQQTHSPGLQVSRPVWTKTRDPEHDCDELYSLGGKTVPLSSSSDGTDVEITVRELNSKTTVGHQRQGGSNTFLDSLRHQLSLVAAETEVLDDHSPSSLDSAHGDHTDSSMHKTQQSNDDHDHNDDTGRSRDNHSKYVSSETDGVFFGTISTTEDGKEGTGTDRNGEAGLVRGTDSAFSVQNRQGKAQGVLPLSADTQGDGSIDTGWRSRCLQDTRGREAPEATLFHAKVIQILPPDDGGSITVKGDEHSKNYAPSRSPCAEAPLHPTAVSSMLSCENNAPVTSYSPSDKGDSKLEMYSDSETFFPSAAFRTTRIKNERFSLTGSEAAMSVTDGDGTIYPTEQKRSVALSGALGTNAAYSSDNGSPTSTQTTFNGEGQDHRYGQRNTTSAEPQSGDIDKLQSRFSSLLDLPLRDDEPSIHYNMDMILRDFPRPVAQETILEANDESETISTRDTRAGTAADVLKNSQHPRSLEFVRAQAFPLSDSNTASRNQTFKGTTAASEDRVDSASAIHDKEDQYQRLSSLLRDISGDSVSDSSSQAAPYFHSSHNASASNVNEGKPFSNSEAFEPETTKTSIDTTLRQLPRASSLSGKMLGRVSKTRSSKSTWVQEKLLLFQRLLNDFETQSETSAQKLVDEMVDVKTSSGHFDGEEKSTLTETCDDLYRSFTSEYLEARQNHVCLVIEDHLPAFRFKRYLRKKHNTKMKGRRTFRVRHRLERLLESASSKEENATLSSSVADDSTTTTTSNNSSRAVLATQHPLIPILVTPTKERLQSDVFTDVNDDERSFRDSAYSSLSASTSRIISGWESAVGSSADVSMDSEQLTSVSSDVFDQAEVDEEKVDQGLLDKLRVCHSRAYKP